MSRYRLYPTAAQWADELGPEPTTPTERLQHTLKAFDDQPDDQFAVRGTTGVYGPGVTTGITWGDLRGFAAQVVDD